MSDNTEVVTFTSMAEGTREDYELLDRLEAEFSKGTADRMLTMLRDLAGSLSGYKIDRTGAFAAMRQPRLPRQSRRRACR